jgi:hypothetical protein
VLSRSPGDHPQSAATPPQTRAHKARSGRWPWDQGRLFRPTAPPGYRPVCRGTRSPGPAPNPERSERGNHEGVRHVPYQRRRAVWLSERAASFVYVPSGALAPGDGLKATQMDRSLGRVARPGTGGHRARCAYGRLRGWRVCVLSGAYTPIGVGRCAPARSSSRGSNFADDRCRSNACLPATRRAARRAPPP